MTSNKQNTTVENGVVEGGSQKNFPHTVAKWAELYCPRWNQTIGYYLERSCKPVTISAGAFDEHLEEFQ